MTREVYALCSIGKSLAFSPSIIKLTYRHQRAILTLGGLFRLSNTYVRANFPPLPGLHQDAKVLSYRATSVLPFITTLLFSAADALFFLLSAARIGLSFAHGLHHQVTCSYIIYDFFSWSWKTRLPLRASSFFRIILCPLAMIFGISFLCMEKQFTSRWFHSSILLRIKCAVFSLSTFSVFSAHNHAIGWWRKVSWNKLKIISWSS